MFHKVLPGPTDALTVTPDQLREQLEFLRQRQYAVISLDTLLTTLRTPGGKLPRRAVLLTFDDAYENNLTYALPVLQAFGASAVLFVPTAFVGGRNEWDGGTDALMTREQLLTASAGGFELAYHSHRHRHFGQLSADAIRADLTESRLAADRAGLPLKPAFAYPYGGRPKNAASRQAMHDALTEAGIELAFRIGNRVNGWPLRELLGINRLDIRGNESMRTFRRKLRWGKLL